MAGTHSAARHKRKATAARAVARFYGGGQILGTSDALFIQPPVNGDGVLVDIEFHADAPGISPLTLSNTFLNLLDTGFAVTNGSVCVLAPGSSVCVSGGSVPEPGALILFSAALGLLVLRHRRSRAA